MSDVSSQGVGTVLEQYTWIMWELLSFFSEHLSEIELKYSAFAKELLAAYPSVH